MFSNGHCRSANGFVSHEWHRSNFHVCICASNLEGNAQLAPDKLGEFSWKVSNFEIKLQLMNFNLQTASGIQTLDPPDFEHFRSPTGLPSFKHSKSNRKTFSTGFVG